MKNYEQKDFSYLLGIQGFSDILLANHFSLYGGYVKNTNLLLEKISTIEKSSIEFNELNRRFSWEFNGMRLHELYFENLLKEKNDLDKNSNLFKEISNNFETYDKWFESFKALGMMRGIGWVLLVKDKRTKELINIWIGEHNVGNLCDQDILLVMDVWEHAYMTDYGIKRLDYINNFMNNINWLEVEKRFL
ncbi:MAG: Fe-Mn family superoxide dismutase [Candidatus Paceibacterota bacterium]|jgi:Fe-Mn family superoxide dismutase